MKLFLSYLEKEDSKLLEMNPNASLSEIPDERVQKLIKDVYSLGFGMEITYARILIGSKFIKVTLSGKFVLLNNIGLEKLCKLGSVTIWSDGEFTLITEFKGER